MATKKNKQQPKKEPINPKPSIDGDEETCILCNLENHIINTWIIQGIIINSEEEETLRDQLKLAIPLLINVGLKSSISIMLDADEIIKEYID